MFDLSPYATVQFYAGRPTKASDTVLEWDGHDYAMEVRSTPHGVEAVMTSGQMEWRCAIDVAKLKEQIDDALQDACQLGQIANWTSDE